MGGGIAYAISKTFTNAVMRDLQTPYADKNKLGTFSFSAEAVKQELIYDFESRQLIDHAEKHHLSKDDLICDKTLFVVNAYTQYKPGKDLHVWAMAAALARVAEEFSGMVFGMPLIGCGIAGGDWDELREMVDIIFHKEELIVVHYDK
jgi:O-acetyl-ADP-ribose deacetylase (regulator of RNase III)